MTKVYLDHQVEAGAVAINRIVRALTEYQPKRIRVVTDEAEADLVIVHVIGRLQQTRARLDRIRARKQAYVIAQYVLRSSINPRVAEWLDVWDGARLVWSYYDLEAWAAEEGVTIPAPVYRSPLGVDAGFRGAHSATKSYDIATTGVGWLQESVRECHRAAGELGLKAWHLGPQLRKSVEAVSGVSDRDLAWMFSMTRYVSGLRRKEGFELPAAEGLICGARPILFDQPHYRQWYGDWAEYIPEEPRPQVQASLVRLLSGPYRPVTEDEVQAASLRFSWDRILFPFWRMTLAA